MGAPYCPPDRRAIRAMGAKVCFLGVPWDQGQMVRAGTSSGPAGLREASTQYFPYMFEYDVDIVSPPSGPWTAATCPSCRATTTAPTNTSTNTSPNAWRAAPR